MTYLRHILEGQPIGIADGLYGNMKKNGRNKDDTRVLV